MMFDIPDMSHMTPEKWAELSHDERMWVIQFARMDQNLPLTIPSEDSD